MLRRLQREERGAVMVMAAFSLTILLLFTGLALDFGRAHLLKAQLQTAVDASSLAGALQVIPMVELEIDRWEWVTAWCTDPVSGHPYDCSYWRSVSPARVSGTEWELIYEGRWLAAAGAQCWSPYQCHHTYRIVREWLVMPADTTEMAIQTFYQNARWPNAGLKPEVRDLTVSIDHGRAEVTTTAALAAPTTFLKLVGIRELRFTRTGSAIPVRR